MVEQKPLKQQNLWLINITVLLHIVVFFFVTVQPISLLDLGQDEMLKKLQSLLAPGAVSLGVICIMRLVLLGMLPRTIRDSLVHWRASNPLPGSRAFTKFSKADPRVDLDKLKALYSHLPTDAREQDRLFYAIYRKHQNETGVLDAHKSYLAMREISILNFLFFWALVPLAYYMLDSFQNIVGYALALALAFLLTSYAAQNYGKRMVENVLAAECTK